MRNVANITGTFTVTSTKIKMDLRDVHDMDCLLEGASFARTHASQRALKDPRPP